MCRAPGVIAADRVNVSGTISASNLQVDDSGGVISTGDLTVSGNITAEGISGDHGVGAFLATGTLTVEGSAQLIGRSPMQSTVSGGCINADAMTFKGTSRTLCEDSSSGNGGALAAKSIFILEDASVELNGATAKYSGGGIYAQSNFGLADSARLIISSATADEAGAIFSSAFSASDGVHLEIVDAQTNNQDESHDIIGDFSSSFVNRDCEFCMVSTKSECACETNVAASGFSQCCHANQAAQAFAV